MDDQETGRHKSDPSPEEIRQACEEIQQEWTPREREKRNGYKVPPVTFNPGCLAEH